MEYRKLGQTDIDVSVICLGTMTYGEQNATTDAHAQLDMATAAGVNFIDTAELYPTPINAKTYGSTESIIGEWLAKRKKRDDLVIASKIAGPVIKHPAAGGSSAPPPLAWIRGGKTRHNRENIKAALNDSLRRLQTDYVDLYQLHWPDRNTNLFGDVYYRHVEDEMMTPLAETLSVLGDFVQAGKIRHIGLSNETPWGLSQCLRLADTAALPRVVSVQNVYNLLNRTYEIGMAEISTRERCGLLPYSPLGFGVLSGKYLNGARPPGARLTLFGQYYKRYTTEKADAAVADYAALAQKHGINMAQMAIAFTAQQAFVTSTIIGATTLEQLQTDLGAAEVAISGDLRRELNVLGEKHFNPCT